MLGQRRRDQSSRRLGIGAYDLLCKRAIARALGQCAHEVHDRVDEPPGEIAAQSGEHDRPHFAAPGRGDRQRADDRDRHDETEQDLGNPIDRIEEPLPFVRRCVIHRASPEHDCLFQDRSHDNGSVHASRQNSGCS